MGGLSSATELDLSLSGRSELPTAEHNVLAQALNERLHDLGLDWPVPYRDD